MDIKFDRKIKLIGIDLDGTLLTDDKKIYPGTKEIFEEADKSGIYIVPITGRPFNGIPKCVKELGMIKYYICSNGANIIDAKSEKTLFSFSIPNDKSAAVLKALTNADCIFEPFADGVCYTEQRIIDSYIDRFKGSPVEEYLRSTRVIIDSIGTLFDDGKRRADEFFVTCANKRERDKISKMLDELGGVKYWYYDNKYIEITREDCDKGSALERLCTHLGIDVKNTLAFGDGDNDLFFLDKAGIAVAMGNAFDNVKEKADFVVESNNDGGVYKTVKSLLEEQYGEN